MRWILKRYCFNPCFISFLIKNLLRLQINLLPLVVLKNENNSNKNLAQELHKPIIKKFEERKVHSPFIYNIWGADLTGMQLISKFNKGIRFLLSVIDIFSKYAWVIRYSFER